MLCRRLRPSSKTVCSLYRFLSTVSSPSKTLSIKAALSLPTPTSEEASSSPITINGWIRSCRRQKNISFAVINDGSNLNGIQAVLSKGLDEGITVGCSMSMRGTVVASKGQGQAKEFRVDSVEILGESNAETYPIQNTKQGVPLTILRRNAHLRPRAAQTAAMLRLRSRMAWATHSYFMSEDYIQVQTPLITSSDCEGAGEVFRVESGPILPPVIPSSQSASSPEASSPSSIPPPPPPPRARYLTVSSQLHLEAIASSFSRVYTLSPAFRAEKSDTSRHLQEFMMLEAEVSFLPRSEKEGLGQVMNVVEGVVRSVTKDVLEKCKEDLDYFFAQTPGLEEQVTNLVEGPAFPRITYDEAIKLLEAHSVDNPTAFSFAPNWGASLQTEHERWLAEVYAKGPIFVIDYPAAQKPWYMLPNLSVPSSSLNTSPITTSASTISPSSTTTSSCFDLLVPRLGELAGGSLRESSPASLKAAMRLHGINPEDYDWYMDLRKYGTTRHGGFGMGWERLIGFLTGIDNVRECTAFPRAAEGSRF